MQAETFVGAVPDEAYKSAVTDALTNLADPKAHATRSQFVELQAWLRALTVKDDLMWKRPFASVPITRYWDYSRLSMVFG